MVLSFIGQFKSAALCNVKTAIADISKYSGKSVHRILLGFYVSPSEQTHIMTCLYSPVFKSWSIQSTKGRSIQLWPPTKHNFHIYSCSLTQMNILCLFAGTYVMKVTATDADDPTYGNSARVVYSILHGQPYFSVDPKTGKALLNIWEITYRRMFATFKMKLLL